MGSKIITLIKNKIENKNFTNRKSQILINHVDINKIVVSSKDPFGDKGLKYLICQKNDKKS